MTKLLSIATAATHPDQLAGTKHSRYPRVDYIELKRYLDTETLDYLAYEQNKAGKLIRYIETQIRSDVYLAALSWWKSQNYHTVFTWSERAGIPFAGLRRITSFDSRFITMFTCWSPKQEFIIKTFNLFECMDEILVHCESMKDNLIRIGAPANRVKLIHYSIDQNFFTPLNSEKPSNDFILTIGEARSRDYNSLFEAVRGLPITLKVAGFGHWYAREKCSVMPESIPDNVSLLQHLCHRELQKQYASSQFVVLPVHEFVYSAGATVSLEAGSMARAVIAFKSPGILDYIIDGETGILVESGNIKAMRDAIEYLLANPNEAKRLGENARQRIQEELNLETYVKNIAEVLTQD